MSPKTGRAIAISLAATGLLVSAVLAWVHVWTYLDVTADAFCTVGATLDCHRVALSRWSVFAGIPLPVWGFVGFLAVGTAAWKRSTLLWPLALLSALASVGLLVEEFVHVGAVCMLCEVVHVLCAALAVVAWRTRDPSKALDREHLFGVVVIPAALLLIARILIPPYWVFAIWASGPPAPTGVTDEGHPWIGAEDPAIVVEEWVDYGCPHCATAANRMRMRVVNHPRSLRVIRRHQPRLRCVETDTVGCAQLRAALCAEQQGKFWEMDSWLFAHAHTPGMSMTEFSAAVEPLGLSGEALQTCLTAPETMTRARALARAATQAGIRETPTYVVDGERVTPAEAKTRLDAAL